MEFDVVVSGTEAGTVTSLPDDPWHVSRKGVVVKPYTSFWFLNNKSTNSRAMTARSSAGGSQRCKRKCISPLQSVQCVGPRGGDVGLQNPDFRILTPLNGVRGGSTYIGTYTL